MALTHLAEAKDTFKRLDDRNGVADTLLDLSLIHHAREGLGSIEGRPRSRRAL